MSAPVNLLVTKQLLNQQEIWSCIFCQTRMFDFNGELLVMWMGDGHSPQEIPVGTMAFSYFCRRCHRDYNIYFQI